MAFALDFDGINDHVTHDAIVLSGDFTIEIKFRMDDLGDNIMASSATANNSWFGYFSGAFRIRPPDGQSTGITGLSAGVDYVATISRTGTQYTISIPGFTDDTSLSGSSNFTFGKVGEFFNSTSFNHNGLIYYIDYNGVNRLDARATSTGSTLFDTIGSKNGTLTNFPTDDTQWVDVGGPVWGLQFDGINDVVVNSEIVQPSGDFVVELDFVYDSSQSNQCILGHSDNNNDVLRITSSTSVLIKISSNSNTKTFLTPLVIGTRYQWKFTRTGNVYDLTDMDDVSIIGSTVGNINSFKFKDFGGILSGQHFAGTLLSVRLTDVNTPANNRFFDADASGGTGNALRETENASVPDGTLTNFPTDDTQWVDISSAANPAGTLSATESGTDVLASSGVVHSVGSLSVTEVNSDGFTASGTVSVTGLFSASESGSDTITASGKVPTVGSLSSTEIGGDSAALTGIVHVVGELTITETTSDGFTASGKVHSVGTLSATEVGSDTTTVVGEVPVLGDVSVVEAGSDTAAVVGLVHVIGSIVATEGFSDTAFFDGKERKYLVGDIGYTISFLSELNFSQNLQSSFDNINITATFSDAFNELNFTGDFSE